MWDKTVNEYSPEPIHLSVNSSNIQCHLRTINRTCSALRVGPLANRNYRLLACCRFHGQFIFRCACEKSDSKARPITISFVHLRPATDLSGSSALIARTSASYALMRTPTLFLPPEKYSKPSRSHASGWSLPPHLFCAHARTSRLARSADSIEDFSRMMAEMRRTSCSLITFGSLIESNLSSSDIAVDGIVATHSICQKTVIHPDYRQQSQTPFLRPLMTFGSHVSQWYSRYWLAVKCSYL